MAENSGWVAIHRSILEWEWYGDINTRVLFLHILLKANYTSKKWRGIRIDRGQLLTGRKELSKETGLSEQQVRTSLAKLISTNEITKSTTPLYTIITVKNYDKFQSVTNKITNEQPTSNQPLTTTNNNNNINKENKYIYTSQDDSLSLVVSIYNSLFNKSITSTRGFEKNYQYWKEVHSLDKIQKALENASQDRFWKDKMTLTILFRRKNPQGEQVDYIEDLANREISHTGRIAII